ncbi:DNA modification methylase [candidate division WOR-3 bacterium]|nr:DNA modification methylase [candidate division WOR-3 bacterium]
MSGVFVPDALRPLLRPVAELTEYPRNSQVHTEESVDELCRHILLDGWTRPLLVWRSPQDGKLYVAAGHRALRAALKLGMAAVPCVERSDWAERQFRTYVIWDNQSVKQEPWDAPVLRDELVELEAFAGPDGGEFDMALTGFDRDEVYAMVHGKAGRPGLTDDDAVPEAVPPRSKTGDVWLCGKHRVMCGDSTKAEDVARLMAGQKADAVVTDPPYGIGFKYASYQDSRAKWFDLIGRVVPMLRGLAPFVVMPCCGIDRMGWWYANHTPDWLLAWYKGSPGHRAQVGFNDWECILTWGKPPNQMHDYFQTACGFKDNPDHPCPKPVAWATWLVERAAEVGGRVVDPFLGSGTTLIACEKLDRVCYGMEIEPRYVDVAVRRWEQFTGREAVLEAAGDASARSPEA